MKIILHNNGKYNLYCTISDGAGFTESCTLEQLTNWVELKYGQLGLDELPARLERAHKTGTSAIGDDCIADTILCNRAGENEQHLEADEFISRFL